MPDSIHTRARRIATLLAGYMRDNLTPQEQDELDEWVGASDKNMSLFEELVDEDRVALALAVLNDEETLVPRLSSKEYTYPFHLRISRGFMYGIMVAVVLEIVLMNVNG
jgi:hypothetical protein